MNNKKYPKLSQICSYGFFFKGLKNEFETAVVKRAISVRAIEVLLYVYLLKAGATETLYYKSKSHKLILAHWSTKTQPREHDRR